MTQFQQTYQYRGYTSKAGYQAIDDALALNCRLYNAALQQRIELYEWYGKAFPYTDAAGKERIYRRQDPGGNGKVDFNRQSEEYTALSLAIPEYRYSWHGQAW